MLLSEMPFKDIVVGMRVRSLSTGNTGIVVETLLLSEHPHLREDNNVEIKWDYDRPNTWCWHFWLDKIEKLSE